MALVKNIKGTLVDIESLVPVTVSFYRKKLNIELEEKEYEPMATCMAYNLAKMKLFPKFSPFDCSLRKIYGSEFFDNKSEEVPDFDGCILLRDAEVYHGDTDGDVPRIGRYPFIAQDPVKMVEKILGNKKYEKVGKASNLATKCMKLNARTTLREFESWTPAQLREAIH